MNHQLIESVLRYTAYGIMLAMYTAYVAMISIGIYQYLNQ